MNSLKKKQGFSYCVTCWLRSVTSIFRAAVEKKVLSVNPLLMDEESNFLHAIFLVPFMTQRVCLMLHVTHYIFTGDFLNPKIDGSESTKKKKKLSFACQIFVRINVCEMKLFYMWWIDLKHLNVNPSVMGILSWASKISHDWKIRWIRNLFGLELENIFPFFIFISSWCVL